MDSLALILSLVAIVMAFMALKRTGGLKDLRQQMDHLTFKTEDAAKGARDVTADALRKLEQMVRGQGAGSGAPPSAPPPDKGEKPPEPPQTGPQP